jgi:hypothetical protein
VQFDTEFSRPVAISIPTRVTIDLERDYCRITSKLATVTFVSELIPLYPHCNPLGQLAVTAEAIMRNFGTSCLYHEECQQIAQFHYYTAHILRILTLVLNLFTL